jgi:hypothetical protein
MWESRLSGSERGRVATWTTGEIMWHRRETRRQTENTNVALPFGSARPTQNPAMRVTSFLLCPCFLCRVLSFG